MNIFEQASRQQLTFDTAKGVIPTDFLWGIPLTSKGGFSLDDIARKVSKELKEITEESFVEVRSNPKKAILELRLEIVKFVIASRIEYNAAQLAAESKAEQRKKLLQLLDKKKEAAMDDLSVEQVEARIAELTA